MSTETMRNSGIEWIGDVPARWEFKRLKYTSTLAGRIGWQGLTSEEYRTEGVHLVTGTDFKEGRIDWDSCVRVSEARWAEATQVQLQEGDLLITKDGTVGKVAKCIDLPGKASLNSGVMVIRHKVPMSTHFLYWVLQSPVFTGWFSDVNAGASTISHLYQADFYNFGFYVPPTVREQELVASLLDAETAKIDQAMSLLRRELETMEQLKKSLIYEAVTKGLDPTVPMRSSGVDWIGDIPEHWEAKKLKFIASFGSGTTPDSGDYSYYDDGEIPWIQSGDLYRKPRITRTEKNVTTKAIRELSALTVYRAPFVVVAMYGASVGNTSLSEIDACLNQACCYIRGNHRMRNEYSFYAISSARSDLISKAQGGTQPNISQIVLKNQVIPIPPISEQSEIIRYLRAKCSSLDCAAKLKQNQMEILANQRKSLVFEYVTGKRRVNEVA